MKKLKSTQGIIFVIGFILISVMLVYASGNLTPGTVSNPPTETLPAEIASTAEPEALSKNPGALIDNNSISGETGGEPQSISSVLEAGTRVMALVDQPSGNGCLKAGDMGTIYCYDSGDPSLPYLVNWDRQGCGVEQSQTCGVNATNGWWVGFNEVGGTTFLPFVSRSNTTP